MDVNRLKLSGNSKVFEILKRVPNCVVGIRWAGAGELLPHVDRPPISYRARHGKEENFNEDVILSLTGKVTWIRGCDVHVPLVRESILHTAPVCVAR
jgi:hypothetical protein